MLLGPTAACKNMDQCGLPERIQLKPATVPTRRQTRGMDGALQAQGRKLGDEVGLGQVIAVELLLENETSMLCVVVGAAFTLSTENAAENSLSGMYIDEADEEGGPETWDSRWMGSLNLETGAC